MALVFVLVIVIVLLSIVEEISFFVTVAEAIQFDIRGKSWKYQASSKITESFRWDFDYEGQLLT